MVTGLLKHVKQCGSRRRGLRGGCCSRGELTRQGQSGSLHLIAAVSTVSRNVQTMGPIPSPPSPDFKTWGAGLNGCCDSERSIVEKSIATRKDVHTQSVHFLEREKTYLYLVRETVCFVSGKASPHSLVEWNS